MFSTVNLIHDFVYKMDKSKSSSTPLLHSQQSEQKQNNIMVGRTLQHAAAIMIHGDLKYKLLHESNIQVCRISHRSTVVNKLLNLKFMRRWESHNIVLGDSTLYSRTVSVLKKTGGRGPGRG